MKDHQFSIIVLLLVMGGIFLNESGKDVAIKKALLAPTAKAPGNPAGFAGVAGGLIAGALSSAQLQPQPSTTSAGLYGPIGKG